MTVGTGTNQISDVATPNLGPKTLGEAIRRNTVASPKSLAIVSSVYEPFSYGQLAAQLDHFATALPGAGFGREARIAIALKDAPRAALAIVSVSCTAVAVPLDPNLTPVEIETRLKLLDVDAVIVLAGDDSPVRDSAEVSGIEIIEAAPAAERELDLPYRAPGKALPASPTGPEPEAPAFILQTSGTTAEPKLIPTVIAICWPLRRG